MSSFSSFQYEYVSGVAPVFNTDGAFYSIFLTNRGSSDAVARAFVLDDSGMTVFDSEDITIPPGPTAFTGLEVDDPRLEAGRTFVTRIFTSSTDVVPSARAFTLGNGDEDVPTHSDIYFAPSDFARFALPVLPSFPRPPVGEVEAASAAG
jgi:hypothetical protein